MLLCDSDFGITPVDDITNGITCAAFCFHIVHYYCYCYYYYYYYYYYYLASEDLVAVHVSVTLLRGDFTYYLLTYSMDQGPS